MKILERCDLEAQIADLVRHHEPTDGWRFEELDPALFISWCDMLIGCRMVIETFDLTVKLSQNQTTADRPGIAQGLRKRAGFGDDAMAKLVEGLDREAASIGNIRRAASGDRNDQGF